MGSYNELIYSNGHTIYACKVVLLLTFKEKKSSNPSLSRKVRDVSFFPPSTFHCSDLPNMIKPISGEHYPQVLKISTPYLRDRGGVIS